MSRHRRRHSARSAHNCRSDVAMVQYLAMRWREVVAHAATPWEWRSRARVCALVAACGLLTLLAVGLAWDRRVGKAAFQGTIAALLLVVPSVRSVRRWDRRHAS